jgi:molybdopterin-guanine dinucleotide biosynthesis protein A
MRVTGVILAGGLATRFAGKPKGLEYVGGLRIIDRVATALRAATDDLLLIANAPDAPSWLPGVPTAPDVRPAAGSLGGIHAALTHAATPVIIVAWDMPFVPAPLLTALRTAAADADVIADAVVPESPSHRGLEPLCAYYTPACLPAIEHHLDAGDHRVISFFPDVHVTHYPLSKVAQFGDPSRIFLNVNTPSDLPAAEELR